MSEAVFHVIDTETGSMATDCDVLSCAIIGVDKNLDIVDKKLYNLYQPNFVNTPQAAAVNKINMTEHSKYEKFFWQYLEEIFKKLELSIIIGHNVSFDSTRLINMFRRYDLDLRFIKEYDTLQKSRDIFGGKSGHKLIECVERFKLRKFLDEEYGPDPNFHNALYDAHATYLLAKVLLPTELFKDV